MICDVMRPMRTFRFAIRNVFFPGKGWGKLPEAGTRHASEVCRSGTLTSNRLFFWVTQNPLIFGDECRIFIQFTSIYCQDRNIQCIESSLWLSWLFCELPLPSSVGFFLSFFSCCTTQIIKSDSNSILNVRFRWPGSLSVHTCNTCSSDPSSQGRGHPASLSQIWHPKFPDDFVILHCGVVESNYT